MNDVCVGQPVTLSLEGMTERVDCVVVSLEGRTATLVPATQAEAHVDERLAAGGSGFLVSTGASVALGLRGAAIVTPQSAPLIEFAITDPA